MFLLPSAASILVTYFLLRLYSRKDLAQPCHAADGNLKLTAAGCVSLFGIVAVAVVLLIVSALRWNLGLPTCLASLAVTAIVLVREKASPLRLAREISWSVLPLVAALFIIVEAVKGAGALHILQTAFSWAEHGPTVLATLAAGGAIGIGTNLVNNLPLGLITGATIQSAPAHVLLSRAVLIGIDLGPNLSITGSLATILWLIAIRREGMDVTGTQFLKAGMLIMPPALLLALLAGMLVAR
jgi:arsenical pump membrane protein